MVTETPYDLTQGIVDLEQRVRLLRETSGPHPADDMMTALGELDIAYEELRVADEELRAQQEEINALLARGRGERAARERMSSLLPMAVLVTDMEGLVLEANAAAALLLQQRLTRLIRTPMARLVIDEDRPPLRTAVTRLRTVDEQRLSLWVRPPGAAPVETSAVGVVEECDGNRVIRWVLLPTTTETTRGLRTGDTRGDDLVTAAAFAELCRLPLEGGDRAAMLVRMAELVQSALPEADSVSLTLGSPTDPEFVGAESSLARRIDELQNQTGEGPCADAYRVRETVVTDDLPSDPRWPALSRRVRAMQVGGVVAVPIAAADDCLGVINAYAETRDAFGRRGIRVAELAGAAVSAVLSDLLELGAARDLAKQLQRALESRAVIDQAKGMIMAKYGGTPDQAFLRLSAISQRSNVKLREVARLLVEGSSSVDQEPKPSPPGAP